MNTVSRSKIIFRGRISKMGNRFVIYIPKALHEMIRELLGIEVIVVVEAVKNDE